MSVWQSKPFEECIENVKYTIKIPRKDFLTEGAYPIISQEDGQINGYWNNADDLFTVDRPVVIFGDHTQILKYVEHDFVLGADGVKILKPKNFLDPRFFYYALTAQPSATLGYARHYRVLKEKTIHYPPLPEQQRIVAVLDEAFVGIATTTENAKKNLHNARALFESHLNTIFTTKGEGWAEHQLSTLCDDITVGHVGSMTKQYKENGIPFLRSQNIRPFEVSLKNVVFISDEFHNSLKKSRLRPGDVAIVRTGYPGTAAVIPEDLPDSNCSDLVIVRPSQKINPHFLAAFFNSEFGKQMVLGKLVGAAQKHFNVTSAKQVILHIPSIQEQKSILSKLDALATETKRLEAIYTQKLALLAALKQSLLQKAFAGELLTDKVAA